MAFRILLLTIVLQGYCFAEMAAQGMLSKKINFSCNGVTPAAALVQLSREAEINIVFNDFLFNECPPLTLALRATPLQQALQQISACADAGFKVVEGQIVFFRRPPRRTLSGYIIDLDTGERLIGSSIRALSAKNVGAVSNEYGFFSFILEPGQHTLSVAHVGYRTQQMTIGLTDNRIIKVRMRAENELPMVTVLPTPTPSGQMMRVGEARHTLNLRHIRTTPMPGGEPDLLRFAGMQPGVQSGVDGLGGLHVRGGNPDHNLILLDDVPVYNPSHALGLFSVFNPATVSSAKLWKGDFPARYGGRIASVLDVRTRDGDMRKFRCGVSTGLLATSIVAEGPIRQDRTSYLLGARATYFAPWARQLSRRNSDLPSLSGQNLNYYFRDANLKINHILSERDRFYLSLYHSGDDFNNKFGNSRSDRQGLYLDRFDLNSEWGNSIAALRWNHVWRKNRFVNTTFRTSNFFYASDLDLKSTFISPQGREQVLENYATLYRTLIRDISLKTDLTWFLNNRTTLRGGVSWVRHHFKPGALSVNFLQPGQSMFTTDSISAALQNNERLNANQLEAYVDGEIQITKGWRAQIGINTSVFQIQDVNYPNVQPRLRLQYNSEKGWSYWGGFSQMAQNLHQIGSFNLSLPFELWVPSTQKVPPELAWQLCAGFGFGNNGWNWQIEGYYKQLRRVLTLVSAHDNLATFGAEDASGWEDRISTGRGESRGIEASVEKTRGKTTGSVAYTWSMTDRTFPDLNNGLTFPFRFDRRHDLKISVQQRITKWLDASVTWSFATGNPITLTGTKYWYQTQTEDETIVRREIFAYTKVNGFRLPPMHRLDAALNARFGRGSVQQSAQIGIYNAYNRSNPFFLRLETNSSEPGRAIQYSLLPLLPVFRYELKF